MISVLLILALARQCSGPGFGREPVQLSGVTEHTQLAGPPNGAHPHCGASVVDSLAEPFAVSLDAGGLLRSLPTDDPEAEPSHPHQVAIIIDAETAGGRNSNEGGQTPTPSPDLREPELSHEAAIHQIQAEEDNLSANPHSTIKQSNSCPADASISQSTEATPSDGKTQARDQCVICLGDLNASIEPELRCGHLFHEDCISTWISGPEENHRLCPKNRKTEQKK
ncbi:hypothetical protein PCANC_01667 [Puccinia coronata f. sp. avenae]|uniref:RING-type domain-containing protein n=1 Tax=Puccinia coronata f. sp. avenae TaxID=200324 RepID=A0A2N5W3C1_9BASI|nr:hypothetical protein PCANC_01667 [Puccinia coronata f. sp. avenae]